MSENVLSKSIFWWSAAKDNVTDVTKLQADRDIVLSCPDAKFVFEGEENALILCRTDVDKPSMCWNDEQITICSKDIGCVFKRFLLLFLYTPVKLTVIEEWKEAIYKHNQHADLRIDFLRMGDFTREYLEGRIARHCVGWKIPKPQEVKAFPEFKVGSLIDVDSPGDDKSNPAFLSVMFGKMGALLQRLNLVANKFKDTKEGKLTRALGLNVNDRDSTIDSELRKIRDTADVLLETEDVVYKPDKKKGEVRDKERSNNLAIIEKTSKCRVTDFPKILLCGDSGVGKTLLAKYVQKVISENVSISRIAIPEYLGKEDYLEYALLGYKKGAFTGADYGSHGLLMKSIGNVVFLDEIGEASATIQAKLLTFMDDYLVMPRGWVGTPFYCPVLIIAATNRDLKAMAKEGRFRKDLLARFTDVEYIPPLRERLESVDYIIDILMQRDDINPKLDGTLRKKCSNDNPQTGFWIEVKNPERLMSFKDKVHDKTVSCDELRAVLHEAFHVVHQSNTPPKTGRWIDVIEPEALMRLRYQDYREGNFRELEEVLRRACRVAHQDGRNRLRVHDIQPL